MQHLERSVSARQEVRIYLLLAMGIVFTIVGFSVDPSRNCSEGGECAPWLVYVALILGLIVSLGAFSALIANHKRGFRIDLNERRLYWWHTLLPQGEGNFSLDEVALIKVESRSDSSDRIYWFDRSGGLIAFPAEEIAPAACEAWAREIAARFSHIRIEVVER